MCIRDSGDMTKAVYDANGDGGVEKAETVPWSGVTGKPNTFPPSTHKHTKSEITDFPAVSYTHLAVYKRQILR